MNAPRILLVDDDPNLSWSSSPEQLRADGYEITTARDGDEACAACVPRGRYLLIVDMMMPRTGRVDLRSRDQGPAHRPADHRPLGHRCR
jgi:DNA-binding response OmpR family regulator